MLLPVPKRLARLCVVFTVFHPLALSCMLSCWILSLCWIILLHMPPLNSSGLWGVWCATRCISAHLLLHTHSVQHVPIALQPSSALPSLSPRRQWDVQNVAVHTQSGVCSVSEPVLTLSPVSVLSSKQLFFWWNPFTRCKHMNATHHHTHTCTVQYVDIHTQKLAVIPMYSKCAEITARIECRVKVSDQDYKENLKNISL